MKKLISSIIFLAAAFSLCAQDARQRTVETVVADALAAIPANTATDFNARIADLAAAAPASVVETAKLMKPAAEGVANNLYEYALSGLADYASADSKCVAAVRDGFAQAVKEASSTEVKAFLLSQFRKIATTADAAIFNEYVYDPALASIAIGALVDIPGTEDTILGLVKEGKADRRLLAAAAAGKSLSAAEPYIQEWVVPKALDSDLHDNAFFSALAAIGSESSLEILKENSPAEYAALAVRLADGSKNKAVAKAAKNLMASEVSAYKSAGALAQMKNDPSKAMKVVEAALGSDDVKYRNSVIDNATALLGAGNLVPLFSKNFSKRSAEVRTDLLDWFGDNKISSVSDIVLGSVSENGAVGAAAIAAAGKIGGEKAAKALVGQLGGENASAAQTALKSFKGDYKQYLLAALDSEKDPVTVARILDLVKARKMTEAAPKVYSLIESGDSTVSNLAKLALENVVGVQDAEKVAALIEKASSDGDRNVYQNALICSVRTLAPEAGYSKIKALMGASSNPSAYYRPLAATGTDEAVADLTAAYESGDKAAAKALLSVGNYKVASVLLKMAGSEDEFSGDALKRYISLVSRFENDLGKKCVGLSKALDLAKTPADKRSILSALSSVPTGKAFLLAGKCLDDSDKSVCHAAAECVRNIASKTTEEIDYADLKANLEKAVEIYRASGSADDGYAVDEIGKILGDKK
jgi:hypothetical protein